MTTTTSEILSTNPPSFRESKVVFNSREFIQLSANTNILTVKKGEMRISFQLEGDLAISLPACPYAGLDDDNFQNENALFDFMLEATKMLESKGIMRTLINESPYFVKSENLHEAYIRCGFRIKNTEINHHLDLSSVDFIKSIHLMERRKIKKCDQEGIEFLQEGSEKLTEIYPFIEQCRKAQGLQMNITYDQLKMAFGALPDVYEIYSIRDMQGDLLAATITVRVNKAVLYNYLPAFDRAYKSFSPLASLTKGLILAYQNRGFKYIDLGISSIDGKIQEGLATFKERMGAIRSKRYTYEYNF